MTLQDIIQRVCHWELPNGSSQDEQALLCQAKGDLIKYALANCACTREDEDFASDRLMEVTRTYSALRKTAQEEGHELAMRHLTLIKRTDYTQMSKRYAQTGLWSEIVTYITALRSTR